MMTGFGRLGLRPIAPTPDERAEEIVNEVAHQQGISPRTLRDRVQFAYIVNARRIAARRIVAELPMLPLVRVARAVGVSHHSSILHYLTTDGCARG